MRNPKDIIGIDYSLYLNGENDTVSDIEYKGTARALTDTEKAIINELLQQGKTREYFEKSTYAQIFGLDGGSLPPVDVVAEKPTPKSGNAKLVFVVVGVVAIIVLLLNGNGK